MPKFEANKVKNIRRQHALAEVASAAWSSCSRSATRAEADRCSADCLVAISLHDLHSSIENGLAKKMCYISLDATQRWQIMKRGPLGF